MNEQQNGPSKEALAYQRLGIAAMKIVYDAAVSKSLVQMMQRQEPAEAVAMAASTVLDKLKEQVSGINPTFVYAVAPAVIAFVIELGGAAGLFEPSPDLMKQATEILQQQLKGQQGQPAPVQPPAEEPAGLLAGA